MAELNIKDLVITSVEVINVFDITTGNYKYSIDELQNTNISQTENSTDVTGKNGRKLSTLKRGKAVTVTGNNGVVSGGLLGSQVGDVLTNTTTKVMWTDYLTVDNTNAATTKYTAVGTAGAEIDQVFVKKADGTLGTIIEQASSVAAGKFTYAPATKKLQFHTDVAEGTEIVVFYKRQISADVLADYSGKVSEKVTAYIDAFAEDKCGKIYRVQFYFPKLSVSGEFSLDMGENQTVHNFTANAESSACAGDNGDVYFTYTIFDNDAEDVADDDT